MSQRPTTLIRNQCFNSQTSVNQGGYVIIGDTAAAILYARRLLANRVTVPITLLAEGVDRTNVEALPDTDFVPTNNNTIFHFLGYEKIHLVTPGDDINEYDPDAHLLRERIYHYARESGFLADFISSPYIPRPGPWFEHSTQSRASNFTRNSTTQMPLSPAEEAITKRLSNKWGIPLTNSIVVKQPSIAGTHHVMAKTTDDGSIERELFLSDYHIVNEASNVTLVGGFSNLKIDSGGCTAGTYNVTYTLAGTTETLECVRVVWKTNPYTFVRLYTEATGINRTIKVPVTYNFVTSIPVNCNSSSSSSSSSSTSSQSIAYSSSSGQSQCSNLGWKNNSCGCGCKSGSSNGSCDTNYTTCINLSNQDDIGDLVTTDIAFSLPDLKNKKGGSIGWACHAFTAKENLANSAPEGQYARPCNTLLMVQGICFGHRRSIQYLMKQKEIKELYNSVIQERNYLQQFATICADVYNAYTGKTLDPSDIITDSSVCTSEGLCSDSQFIRDFSYRETPPGIFINTIANLYSDLEVYKAAGSC